MGRERRRRGAERKTGRGGRERGTEKMRAGRERVTERKRGREWVGREGLRVREDESGKVESGDE